MVEITVCKRCSFLLGFLKTSVEPTPCTRHERWKGNTVSDLVKLTSFWGMGGWDGKWRMAMILREKSYEERQRETMEAQRGLFFFCSILHRASVLVADPFTGLFFSSISEWLCVTQCDVVITLSPMGAGLLFPATFAVSGDTGPSSASS